jgi:hypothetical protein
MTMVGDPIGALLAVTEAQLEALERGDFDAFQRIADRRDSLLATLPVGPADPRPAPDAVHQLLELDRRVLELARRMHEETARELAEIRRGHVAVRGYGRPGTILGVAEQLDQTG